MITVKTINPERINVYDPNGSLVGTVNEYELLDIRVQIKKQKLTGYYLVFKEQEIRIDINGELEDYPIGLLDTMNNLYLKLI